MKTRQQAIQCREEFSSVWVGKVPGEIVNLFSAIIEKSEKENIFDINLLHMAAIFAFNCQNYSGPN